MAKSAVLRLQYSHNNNNKCEARLFMLRKLLSLAFVCLFAVGTALGQAGSLTGTVTDAKTGETLAGANVYIVELGRGAATNTDGEYEITEIPAGTYTVRVTYIGYNRATRSVEVSSGSVEEDFSLESGINLGEVVVSALGQEVDQNTISFSSQEVSEEQLNITQVDNIKTGLAGKIAGVQIVGQAGSKLGAFGDIRIRGAISLTNELAEPLYVVDGVPVSNPNIIDMNNVANINVLKGPNATALYGQRGENGVVLITTKKDNKGVSVEITNSLTFDKVAYLPEFQNEYGQGYGGASEWTTLDFSAGSVFGTPFPSYFEPLDGKEYIFSAYADESWGPKFDGRQYVPWYAWWPDSPEYGKTIPYEAQPDNVRNFYDTGVTNKAGLAVNYSTDRSSARISYTNQAQGGLLPYSNLTKHYTSGRFSYDVTEQLKVSANVKYTLQEVTGEVRSDGYGNQTSGSFNSWFARNMNMSKMREYRNLTTPEGIQASWNWWGPDIYSLGSTYHKPVFWFNPYKWQDDFNKTRNRDNLLANLEATYEFNDQWALSVNANTTRQIFKYRWELPYTFEFSAAPNLYTSWVNSFGQFNTELTENDYSARLNYQADYGDWNVNAFGGSTMRVEHFDRFSAQMDRGNTQSGGLIIPNVYQYSNSRERVTPVERNWDKNVFSLYAKTTIGYKDFIYLDGTYRQDWSSALPADNNGYGYPSVGLSFVFTELIDVNSLSYGKFRAGWAQVGNDVDAERILGSYDLSGNSYTNPKSGETVPLLYTDRTRIDPDIKPALNSSFEAGLDLRFFDDKIGLNATFYKETRKDEIIGVSLSTATGAQDFLTNAGSSERTGIEVSLNGVPVRTADFRWDATLNFAKNRTIVTELPEGLDTYELGRNSAFGFAFLTHKLNEEWGQLRGAGYVLDDQGRPLLNPDGTYVVQQNKFFGSVLPDWTGGFINTFSYKNVSLTTAIDFQKGGKFFSLSENWGTYSGLLEETAGLNDQGNPVRDPVADGGGVHMVGQTESGASVDMYVPAQTYFKQWYSNRLAEPFIHDASYVKLRELSLNYTLSQEMLGGFVKSATVGVVGRNVLMIALAEDNKHNWDPSELAEPYGENGQLPGTRSYGFNVKLTF